MTSVLANAAALAERMPGLRLETIPVTPDGVVDLEALRVLLREGKGRALVAVMAANNETGVIQPHRRSRRSCCKEHDALSASSMRCRRPARSRSILAVPTI